MPESEKEGLIKVCYKENKLYLFFSKKSENKDVLDRPISNNVDIYEISDFSIDEIIEKFKIQKELSEESKYYALNLIADELNKDSYSFEDDYLPFLILKILKKELCFEKKKIIFNKNLDKLKNCVFSNFSEDFLKEFFEFLKNKKLGQNIKNCLKEEIINYLDECEKEVYLYAKKLDLLDSIYLYIGEVDCIELKRRLLLKYIEIADDEKIDILYKASKKKLFVLGM